MKVLLLPNAVMFGEAHGPIPAEEEAATTFGECIFIPLLRVEEQKSVCLGR